MLDSVPLDRFPCISMIAYTGRKMKVGGISLPIVVDLHGLEIPRQNLALLLNHELPQIVGLTMQVEIVHNALLAVGVVDDGLPSGHDVWRSGLLGYPWRASIGASLSQPEYVNHGQHVEVNGRPVMGPCYVIRQATLQEISLVTEGADNYTSVYFHPPKT
ncbi:MAG: hypothetical protein FWH27_09785 [Planctomycetaceae bacterium]|nr:hypothetical protein [Planctomycetaceae bacterium]